MLSDKFLSEKEKNWLKEHNYVIRLGYMDHNFPYSGADENGEMAGVLETLIESMEHEFKLQVETSCYQTQEEMTEALKRGEIDHSSHDLKEQEAQKSDISGSRILLVEDNDLNMEIAEFILKDAGADVTKATNGKEAVTRFAGSGEGSFDVILMDIMMPVMDGLEAARRIRSMERSDADIPIFAMTANAFSEDVEKSREAGMNEHIPKPIDAGKMLNLIAKYRKK